MEFAEFVSVRIRTALDVYKKQGLLALGSNQTFVLPVLGME